ncbi:hypothetical protein AVEN_189089-1 [Araneus ventricosus]|uniref:Tc1-like transposase DDE domain-containing protein n=1 Tax=Araneus ventricosus TaxID=182803 RepID=A0A4Y2TB40_ARAVE|nr:hypothetical protein AVEN_189089-1 [Araneus ventricosus]
MFGRDDPIVLTSMQKKGESLMGCRARPSLLSSGVLFLDDSAILHTARETKEHIRRLGWERLDHPPYSPDLAPPDFHLLSVLKSALLGRHYRNAD